MASTSPFGEHLKRERELRGVSIEEVSAATRISTKFLEAIESGRWDDLPGGAFNRGFIRSASKFLGLDEDSMVAEYSLETNGNGRPHETVRQDAELPRDWRPVALFGAIVLIVLLALAAAGWFAVSKIRAHRRAQAATSQPAAAPAASVLACSNATGLNGQHLLTIAVRAISHALHSQRET